MAPRRRRCLFYQLHLYYANLSFRYDFKKDILCFLRFFSFLLDSQSFFFSRYSINLRFYSYLHFFLENISPCVSCHEYSSLTIQSRSRYNLNTYCLYLGERWCCRSKTVFSVRYTGCRWKCRDHAWWACELTSGKEDTQDQRLPFYTKDEKSGIEEDLLQRLESDGKEVSHTSSAKALNNQGRRPSQTLDSMWKVEGGRQSPEQAKLKDEKKAEVSQQVQLSWSSAVGTNHKALFSSKPNSLSSVLGA